MAGTGDEAGDRAGDERGVRTRSGERDEASRTRRGFLGVAATLGAAGLAGCASIRDEEPVSYARTAPSTPTATPGTTEAQTGTEGGTDTQTETQTMAAPDVPTLNYALTLEHLENALYREGLDTFADGEFVRAEVLSRFDERLRREVPTYLRTTGAHEAAHVEALAAAVRDRGGEPVAAAEYEFGFETPAEFLQVARRLENVGVAAYAGVAPRIVDGEMLATALGVHSVEARHAGLLNLLVGRSPFPNAVDDAASMGEVLATVGGVVASGIDPGTFERETTAEPERTREDGTGDVDVLNDLLALERLERALYREGLDRYDATDLAGANVLRGFSFPFRAVVHRRLSTARAHEAAHVEAIAATITDLGGEPVAAAEYDFGYRTPSEFLEVARTLENASVTAYAGAAPSLANDDAFATALGVHGVEARHAGFLNLLEGTPPYPDAVDEPRSPAEIRAVVDRFTRSSSSD